MKNSNLEVLGRPNAEEDALDALLAGLGVPDVETVEEIDAVDSIIGDLELEAAGDLAAEQAEIDDDAETDADADLRAAAKAAKKGDRETARAAAQEKREADKTAKKAAREAKKAEREASGEKPAAVPRKHYASKSERLGDKLGADLGSYTVLTLADAALTGDELATKQQETMDTLSGAGVKVQNRMTLLMEFCAGKSGKLNEVIARAFALLKKDGQLTTGEKGNFHRDLLAKPYSAAAARAMGNNTLAALRNFKVINLTEKGTYVPNPDSLMLMKANSLLGLS